MSCPYHRSDCPQRTLPAGAESCPQCLRFLKSCPACGTSNRAFANFCRSCRAKLSVSLGNWVGYKGGPQRLGLNALALPEGERLEIRETDLKLQLGDPCRSLLGYDRHLVAVSQGGTVEVGDPELPGSSLRLKADGPISCEPCIDQGVLYLGSPGRLAAYSLGALTLANPRLSPLWQLPLSGTPVQALTVLENRMYVNVFHQDGRKQVQVIENLERSPPMAARVLCAGSKLGWTAADPASRQVVFFSQTGESVQLHTATHDTRLELGSLRLPRMPQPIAEQVPIVLLGGKIYGVFGDEERLCRIDARTGDFEHALGSDTKLFSLARDWDGDGVRIDTNGVIFLRSGLKDSFPPLERVVKGSPVILQGRAAVLGMQDGRLRVYDLRRLPRYDVLRLTGDNEPITALASFHSYVAVGTAKGVVKVLEMSGKGAAA